MAAFVVIVAMVFVGVAVASDVQTATITSAKATDRHLIVDWTLPAGVEAWAIEVATKPDVGTDGHFFTENVTGFDVLDKAQTHYVSTSQLDFGTYFVHIETYDNNCDYTTHTTCLAWSPAVTLTLAALPPPLPKPNQKPRLTALSWTMKGHNPGPGYYATVTAKFRVCDDDKTVRVVRTERTWLGTRTFATATAAQSLAVNGCATHSWTWRLAAKYFGVGHYTVKLHAVDARAATSNVVTHDWYTSD